MVRKDKFVYGCLLLSCIIFMSGCGTAGQGVRIRTYAQDKPRVDQSMNGNAGYIFGTPQQVDRANIKKTRRVYIFEATKVPEHQIGSEEIVYPNRTVITLPPRVKRTKTEVVTTSSKIILPSFDDEDETFIEEEIMVQSSELVDYTVLKNDTMQKISKKFYGGFSKWPRIYDANRDVIKDPNKLKPGTQIKIPMVNK